MKESTDFSKRLARALPNDAERQKLWQALDEMAAEAPIVLRKNRLRPLRPEHYSSWVDCPVPWSLDAFFAKSGLRNEIKRHPYVLTGALYWQEGAATEAVELLDPQPDDYVLDLCAAPGSKSTHIAERLAPGKGWLWANEVNRARAEKLREILARHGCLWSTVSSLSAEKLEERFPSFFDKILLDAPCSGESLFSKRKDSREDVPDREVRKCAAVQSQLLRSAARVLRPGGKLLYATCTYSCEENEDVIHGFLAQEGHYSLIQESRRWPHADGVAGGYMALLQREGSPLPRKIPKLTDWSGVLWSAGVDWKGQPDAYAWAMAPEALAAERLFESGFPSANAKVSLRNHIINREDAQRYLSGEALRHAEFTGGDILRLLYENCPMGAGRAVDGRLNSLLPKGLRAL